MTIKEMCEYSNIEYNKDHPKRSLNKLCQIYEIEKLGIKGKKIVANYTMNIENNFTVEELKKLGICKYTVPAEAEKETQYESMKKRIQYLYENGGTKAWAQIVYGRTLLMTTEYCTIGTLKNCPTMCQKGKYTLKDRMGFEFPIYTDRVNCNNLIYNSKITSISYKDLDTDSIRIDILEETQGEIQEIIDIHKRGERLEGQDYTNGNLNREI